MFFRCALEQSGTGVRVIARRQSQPSQHWRSSNMCFSSRHGIIDVDFLHDRCLEFARAGVVNHAEENHCLANQSEVLKSHLRSGAGFSEGPCVSVIQQRCHKFEMSCSSSCFSIWKKRGSQRQGFRIFTVKSVCEIHYITGRESIEMISEDPITLEHGKGGWPCCEAGCTFIPSLRRLGARSVYIFNTRFLTWRCRARCSGCSSSNLVCSTITSQKNSNEWFVSIGCCAHDIQKSLRWASSGLISAR